MEPITLTQCDIDRLAAAPNTEVYANSFAREFEPWDPIRVRNCMKEISIAVARGVPLSENVEWRSFAEYHPTLYKLAQSADERLASFIDTMLQTKLAENRGVITSEQAAMIIVGGIRENGCKGDEPK